MATLRKLAFLLLLFTPILGKNSLNAMHPNCSFKEIIGIMLENNGYYHHSDSEAACCVCCCASCCTGCCAGCIITAMILALPSNQLRKPSIPEKVE